MSSLTSSQTSQSTALSLVDPSATSISGTKLSQPYPGGTESSLAPSHQSMDWDAYEQDRPICQSSISGEYNFFSALLGSFPVFIEH